ncbi:MAG TPA: FAD-binding protein [Myxococcaceae bacterium]|nr:FAD-binding protein [Myxococcaceae bacterium]
MNEVLVIGGGMAGAVAALSARRRGAKVRLVRRSLGATALSSGAIDVAPDPVAPGGELAAHVVSPMHAAGEVARVRPQHPYGVLREQLPRLEEALRFAVDALPGFLAGPLEKNALLPTALGTVKPSAMGQRNVLGGDVATLPDRVAVVSFPLLPWWDARLIARGVEQGARALGRRMDARVVECRFFDDLEDSLRPPFELGQRLDDPSALEALAADLRGALPSSAQAVLVPPVLGRRVPDVADRLGQLLGGIRCAEILSSAPSLPGIRLQEALDAAMLRAEIQLEEATVDGSRGREGLFALRPLEWEPGRDEPPLEVLRPDAVVLATGKFIGGGVERTHRFTETVLGLPVFSGARELRDEYIGELLSENLAADQVAFRAGVQVDGSLRPLDASGRPAHPRLFAAGAVLTGHDPSSDKTGLGVAIFTGYLAGELASG